MPKRLLLALLLLLDAGPGHTQSRPRLPARAWPRRVVRLDRAVLETSALQYTDGALWTLNDGGNAPVLFRLDSATGRVQQRVRITNFENVDWEALAADARYFYIGDFGNNAGRRRNLRVLRLPRPGPADTTAVAEAIAFQYPDQTDFDARTYQHNFDCEAFFVAHDSLHLFTKNWADGRTRYYTLPARPGTYAAHLQATLDTRGLVTAAALSPGGRCAALLGYKRSGATFLWLLTDFAGTRYFSGQQRRLRLPHALRLGQAEGLCFVNDYRVFISNERLPKRLTLVPQRLYVLSLRRWLLPPAGAGRGQ